MAKRGGRRPSDVLTTQWQEGEAKIHSPAAAVGRVASIDLVRGAVMVLMAVDHVRVFSGMPPGGPSAGLFLTRWITHFCAPAFFFLAGASAWLYARKRGASRAELTRFLATRGLWLILLELTVCRLAWTFNFDFAGYEMAGVLWALGWSMVALALLTRLPIGAVAAFGFVLIGGHNLLDGWVRSLVPTLGDGASAALWKIAYVGFAAGPIELGPDGPRLIVLYSLIPWVGVMAAGYAAGRLFELPPERRDRILVRLGLGATALFLLLRGLELYGDPRTWSAAGRGGAMPAVLAFLNTTKYPASLQFLLMTLGPMLALLPWAERSRGAVARSIALFGRVPFFFYLVHIPLIHLLALGVSWLRTGEVSVWLFTNHPMANPPPPAGYAWGLPVLYATWAVALVLLYPACRSFAAFKSRHPGGWSSYF